MRGAWSLTRCAAPVRPTSGGAIRCDQPAHNCITPGHARWRRFPNLMALVWWIRPWWPNRIGRLQDRGLAHVCPNVMPCRFCDLHGLRSPHACDDPTCREDHR